MFGDQTSEPPHWGHAAPAEPWTCVAGSQKVWKVFCAQFWTELLWAGDDDESEVAPTGSYYDCVDVQRSKDCKLIKPEGN